MADGTYAPQSPDLSAYHSSYADPPQPDPQQLHYRGSFSQPSYDTASYYTPQPPPQRRVKEEDEEYLPDYATMNQKTSSSRTKKSVKTEGGAGQGIVVHTKFPVARIKRIMQADEDVGKVAQVTPVAVSKALELFMINIVTKSAQEARSRSSKRVTASHLKQALVKDEQFDFLQDIISKVPDAPTAAEKTEDVDEALDTKKKRGIRKKRQDSDDF